MVLTVWSELCLGKNTQAIRFMLLCSLESLKARVLLQSLLIFYPVFILLPYRALALLGAMTQGLAMETNNKKMQLYLPLFFEVRGCIV